MGKLILVLGGERSGKSAFAEELAGRDRKVAYVATALPVDLEMQERVRVHRARRPKTWATVEQAFDVHERITKLGPQFDALLIDCILIYVSNMLLADDADRQSEPAILAAIDRIVRAARVCEADVIVVSGEVGMGVIPENALARKFADAMGKANQKLAAGADEVYHVIAGLPQRLKPAGGAS